MLRNLQYNQSPTFRVSGLTRRIACWSMIDFLLSKIRAIGFYRSLAFWNRDFQAPCLAPRYLFRAFSAERNQVQIDMFCIQPTAVLQTAKACRPGSEIKIQGRHAVSDGCLPMISLSSSLSIFCRFSRSSHAQCEVKFQDKPQLRQSFGCVE